MAATDVRDLARLHSEAFPGFFLSTMGEPFLVQFYGGFLQDETAISVRGTRRRRYAVGRGCQDD